MSDPVDELIRQAQGRVGTTLKGKYRLERLLGLGGMAAVYEGVHRNGNRVAIKVVHRQLSLDAEVRSRFLQEGYAANNVEHPGVVRTLDDEIAEDGSVFLVMELLQGSVPEDEWEGQPPRSAEEVLGLGFQLLDVLVAAGGKGIVHRDLKPQNLFVTEEGMLKVLDFGLARMEEASAAHATMSGQVFGTPAYMPPEQALGRVSQIDHQSDQWAVGATLFSLLSGKFVHVAQTSAEHLIMTATRPARSLATVAPNLPKPIVQVVDRALSYDKAQRFPDARAMQAALEAAFEASYGYAMPHKRVAMGRAAAPSVAQGLPPVSTTVRENAPTLRQHGLATQRGRALMWVGAAAMSGVIIVVAAFVLSPDSMTTDGATAEPRTASSGEALAVTADPPPDADAPLVVPSTASASASTSASASASTLASPDGSASAAAGRPPSTTKWVPQPSTKKKIKPPETQKKSSAWDSQ